MKSMVMHGKRLKLQEHEAAKFGKKSFAYSISSFYSPKYFFIAEDLVELAEQLNLPEDERSENYKEESLEETINNIFPDDFDSNLQNKLLLVQVNILTDNLNQDDDLLQKMFGGRTEQEAVDYLLSKSRLTSKEEVIALAKEGR